MSSDNYQYPVAISRMGEKERSREPQNARAVRWLLNQAGGSVTVVTPQKRLGSDVLQMLISQPGVTHLSWKGLSGGSLSDRRVLYAWPDRDRLNELWGVAVDALAVIEWNPNETAEWIADANPVQLLESEIVDALPTETGKASAALPNGIEEFLTHIANWVAGYDSGLKWDEEDKVKADMMNVPERWRDVTVEQVRGKCRELGMSPKGADTIAGFLQRRKDGRRFNVRGSYRTYRFN